MSQPPLYTMYFKKNQQKVIISHLKKLKSFTPCLKVLKAAYLALKTKKTKKLL